MKSFFQAQKARAFALLLLLLTTVTTYAHVTEIRVNQAQDGSLTWYLSSYHSRGECGIGGSGLTINGVNYPLQAEYTGDVASLSSNVFATRSGYPRVSYAIVRTPFLGTTLSVQPYSTNACWAFQVGGNGNFTPPPPPVCTSSPLTGWSNTFASSGNNNGTYCDLTDDKTTATIKVNHLACANITGDKQFRVIYDPNGANVSYGPFNYASGVETSVQINVPYGASNSTQVKVIDDDFPAEVTHGLMVPNGLYLGEKETVLPTITAPAGVTVSTDLAKNTASNVALGMPITADNCAVVNVSNNAPATFPLGVTPVVWTVTDASGNTATAIQTVTVKDTEAPVFGVSGTKTINIPSGQSANWRMYRFNFADPLPAGARVTGITLSYSGNDQGWGGTGAWARMIVSGKHIGSNQFFPARQNFTINYQGEIPDYVYGGNNFLQMDFDTYPGWVAYFHGGTMTIHYTVSQVPEISGQCSVTVASAPTATDNSSGNITGTTTDPLIYNTQGEHLITWTFNDGHGNSSTATQKVIVKDTQPPVIPVLADVTGECSATVASAPVTADNCTGTVTGTTTNPLTYTTQGTHVITWTFDDGNGNVVTAKQNVVVKDVTVPITPTLADVTGECSATVTGPTTTDNCAGTITGTTTDPLTYTTQGTHVITWTFADGNGNSVTALQNVIVKDVIKPTITAPIAVTVNTDPNSSFASNVELGTPLTADNCSVSDVSNNAPAAFPLGTTAVVWTVTDASGNTATATQEVTVKDTEKPVVAASAVTVPADPDRCDALVSVPALSLSDNSGTVGYIETFDKLAQGNVSKQNFVWQVWPGGASSKVSTEKFLTAPNSLKVQDGLGEDQLLLLGDQTSGQWTISFNMFVPAGRLAYYNIQHFEQPGLEWANQVYFNADGTGKLQASGEVSFNYPHEKWFEVKQIVDLDNDKAILSIDGVVIKSWKFSNKFDGQAGTKKLGGINFYPNGANSVYYVDNVALYGTPNSMGQFVGRVLSKTYPVGTANVDVTVHDLSGNSNSVSFDVTVEDKVAPVALAKNVTISLNAYGKGSTTAEIVNNGSRDACGIKSIHLSKTEFTCENIGENQVILTVTDNNGNVSTAVATVTVEDKVAPVALAKNVTVSLDAYGKGSTTAELVNNGSNDACGIQSIKLSNMDFDCSNIGANEVTLTVTDNNGNVSTATATVTVEDKVAPVALAKNISVTLVNGQATITASGIDNGSSDACGIASMTLNKSSFTCDELGNHTVILTVTDNNGNSSTATTTVTVIGVKPDLSIAVSRTDNTFTGLDSKTIALGYGAQSLTLTASNSTSASHATTYVWSPAAGLSNATSANPVFSPTAAGTYTFYVTATNEFGCSATTSVIITVLDVRCGDKVLVCQKTGSAKNPWVPICINENAVAAHLKKGSTLGSCFSAPGVASQTTDTKALSFVSTLEELMPQNSLSAYPNPFGKQSTVRFQVSADQPMVSLDAYDMRGIKVKTLYTGKAEAGRNYEFKYDGTDLPPGTYFLRLITSSEVLNFKLIMLE